MDKELLLGTFLTGLQATFTTLQDNPVYQIIQMVLSIVSGVILIAYTIWKWYYKAKEDGKITLDEIDEGVEIIVDALDYMDKNKEDNE